MDRKFLTTVAASSVTVFALTWAYLGGARYYPDCGIARAFGAESIKRGEPGYRDRLDGDHDGIACEPYHGGGQYFESGRGRWRR